MVEPREGSADHRVPKSPWSLELDDPRRQPHRDTEVPGLPRDGLTQLEQAARPARDGHLAMTSHRGRVKIDIACKVEDAFGRRADLRQDPYDQCRGALLGRDVGRGQPAVD